MAFINNYSTLSEERHKKISNILSNTETNRNAFVPVQFSANLPRETSTNSTASSTSDVSCRSNPNVSSYCANTNMSSEISSMFYGAVLHVNTLNVNLYTNPHNWARALYCLSVLVNTFLWISSVCWNKWLIFLFSLQSTLPRLHKTCSNRRCGWHLKELTRRPTNRYPHIGLC